MSQIEEFYKIKPNFSVSCRDKKIGLGGISMGEYKILFVYRKSSIKPPGG